MNNTDSIKTWLAHRLNTAIAASGLRIDAISNKSGMPYSTLNSKRRGYSTIGFEDILTLSPILGVPASYFIPPQMTGKAAEREREEQK